jgi:ABC-type protease/lipase transport system fused ATPase/permease subunit
MTNPNDSATGFAWSADQTGTSGLTKREYFAAMAMQGILANRWSMENVNLSDEEKAYMSVNMADALINALNTQRTT